MVQTFIQNLKRLYTYGPQAHFLLAVSGGLDSVVLTELCLQAGLQVTLAHCNFGLRGAESDRDEAFVRALAEQNNMPVVVKQFDTQEHGHLKKLSIQEAARELRYTWFEETRQSIGADYTLLAHHANDTIETLLLNFFRGTGLAGLTGIPPFTPHGHCLRPLLSFTREELQAFATEHKLKWVEDSSNASSKYSRNFFRNELLPAIKKIYPQVEQNLLANIERFTRIEALYNQTLTPLLQKLLVTKANGDVHMAVNKLMQWQHTALPYEVLKKFGFTENFLPQFLALSQSESGRYIQNETYRILKNRAWFIISPRQQDAPLFVLAEEGTKSIDLPGFTLTINVLDARHCNLNKEIEIAQLDAAGITFPLIIRRWKEGDYFYPLGMRKKKKLARFFIDQKLSLADKEKIWIVESDKRILWIVSHRIDDRFKLTETTKTVLQLTASSL